MIICSRQEWHKFTVKGNFGGAVPSKPGPPINENRCQNPATHFFVCTWNDGHLIDARCDEHPETYLQETYEVTEEEYVVYWVMTQ